METPKPETIGQMFGRLGGQATSKKHGKAHYIRMQQLSVKKRKKITEFDITFK